MCDKGVGGEARARSACRTSHKAKLQHLKASAGSSDMDGEEKGVLMLALRPVGQKRRISATIKR